MSAKLRAYINKPIKLGEPPYREPFLTDRTNPERWVKVGESYEWQETGLACSHGAAASERGVLLIAGEFMCPLCALESWNHEAAL